MASVLLSEWVNPSEAKPNIPESDQRWVGLWWVGFLVSAGLMLIFSSLMVSFPEKLPDSPYVRPTDKKKNNKDEKKSDNSNGNTIEVNISDPSIAARSGLDNFSIRDDISVFTSPSTNPDLILNENSSNTNSNSTSEELTKKTRCQLAIQKTKGKILLK